MNISIASRSLASAPMAYQPYAPAYAAQAVPVSNYNADLLTLQPKPAPDPNDIPPPDAPGSIWSRADVRVGLMMAGTATAGGTVGYFASRAAGTSLAWGTALGATIGAALPIALVIWGLSRWGK
jgi:hypothetical protein